MSIFFFIYLIVFPQLVGWLEESNLKLGVVSYSLGSWTNNKVERTEESLQFGSLVEIGRFIVFCFMQV